MTHRNHPGALAIAALSGVIVGVASCLAAQHFVPMRRAQPAMYTTNALHFGVDELGRPALCDEEGEAYVLSSAEGASMQELGHSTSSRPEGLQSLFCKK